MRRHWSLLTSFVIIVLAVAMGVPSRVTAQSVSLTAGWYTVARVVDGDTVWVRELPHAVRLAGIDAPELGAWCGSAARAELAQRVGGRVYLEPASIAFHRGTSRYRAYVWTWDGATWRLAQEQLLAAGLARMDTRAPWATDRYWTEYQFAERAARQTRSGLWGGRC